MTTKLTCAKLRELIKSLPNTYSTSGIRKDRLVAYYEGLLEEERRGIVRKSFAEMKAIPLKIMPVECVEPNWHAHLMRYGWATLPLMTPEVASHYTNCYWTWLESLTPDFKRDNPRSWRHRPPQFNGIFRNYISHLEWVWQIREICYPIFQQIWQTDDLLCSFDSGCFLPSAETPITQADAVPFTAPNHWMHCDQPRCYSGMVCVQGIVNLLDNGPLDGGLLLVDKSKDVYDDYIKAHPSEGIEYFHIDMDDPLTRDKQVIKICAKPGHMILWDSRMFHSNTNPLSANPRMCTYVSMQPSLLATPKQRAERISLYENGRGTGHWVGGEWYHTRTKEAWAFGGVVVRPETIEIAPLNDLRRKLIGYP